MNFNTILPNLGTPTKCKICQEEWFGLSQTNGICPRCTEKNTNVQNIEQKETDLRGKIIRYLANHKWRLPDEEKVLPQQEAGVDIQ